MKVIYREFSKFIKVDFVHGIRSYAGVARHIMSILK